MLDTWRHRQPRELLLSWSAPSGQPNCLPRPQGAHVSLASSSRTDQRAASPPTGERICGMPGPFVSIENTLTPEDLSSLQEVAAILWKARHEVATEWSRRLTELLPQYFAAGNPS